MSISCTSTTKTTTLYVDLRRKLNEFHKKLNRNSSTSAGTPVFCPRSRSFLVESLVVETTVVETFAAIVVGVDEHAVSLGDHCFSILHGCSHGTLTRVVLVDAVCVVRAVEGQLDIIIPDFACTLQQCCTRMFGSLV